MSWFNLNFENDFDVKSSIFTLFEEFLVFTLLNSCCMLSLSKCYDRVLTICMIEYWQYVMIDFVVIAYSITFITAIYMFYVYWF